MEARQTITSMKPRIGRVDAVNSQSPTVQKHEDLRPSAIRESHSSSPYTVTGNRYVDSDKTCDGQHGQPPSGPVWSLARPFARIVRPGMRREASHDQDLPTLAYPPAKHGPTSPIPQLKRLTTRHQEERKCPPPIRRSSDRKGTVLKGTSQQLRYSAYGPGGLPKVLARSVSADGGLRHYARLENAAKEVDHALNTDDLARNFAMVRPATRPGRS